MMFREIFKEISKKIFRPFRCNFRKILKKMFHNNSRAAFPKTYNISCTKYLVPIQRNGGKILKKNW